VSLALAFPDGKHGRLPSRWSAARVLAPHKGQAWPGGRHATTCRGLATPPGPPSNGDEPASRHLIQPLESPIPRLGTTAHQLSGANRRPTGHARPGPLWTARHPRLRRPRDRPNLTRIPWTRSALIQDCHETQTRLPYGEAPTADYGGAMRDNLSRRPPICNKRLYHDQSTNRDCHGSNGAVSSASDLLHHRSQVMRRTETATDLYRTVSSDSEHGATWAATYLGPLRTIAEIGPGPITL